MPKSLLIVTWTLVVAVAAYTAGRWTASIDEPVHSPEENTFVSSPAATPQFQPAIKNVPPAAGFQELPNKPSNGSARPRGYAADYQEMQALIALAATNPQLAMEKTQAFRGAIKAKAQAAILEVWGGIDPNGAWNWVASFQPENNEQFIKLLEVIGRSEPRTAVSFAERFVTDHREFRKDIYLSALTGITQAGAYSLAADLVGSLDIEPETKTELASFVAGAWAAYEPQAAMQWVMRQSEEVKTTAVGPLGESWSDVDPQGAINFAATLSGDARESLLMPSFKKWLVIDPAAATAWLSAAPPDKDFDSIISEVATRPSSTNGQVKEALTWAGKVSDPELRVNTLLSILSAFKQKDPAAAAAYLQEVKYLTDAEYNRVREDLAF